VFPKSLGTLVYGYLTLGLSSPKIRKDPFL
jgi:hypothetical protein